MKSNSLQTASKLIVFIAAATKVNARLNFRPEELSAMSWTEATTPSTDKGFAPVYDSNSPARSKSDNLSPQEGSAPLVQLSFTSSNSNLMASKAAAIKAAAPAQSQVTLQNVLNGLMYNVQVTMGNGQIFNLNPDTGSADTWFRGPNCQNPSNDGSCVGSKVNIADSSIQSQNANWQTNYGIGSVKGQIYQGQISLGGLSATIPFGVSTVEDGCSGTDGLIGLGFNAPSSSNITTALGGKNANLWDAFGFTGNQNVFGFFLSATGNGQITLGGIDSSKIAASPVYFPLLQEATRGYIGWFFDISTATVSVLTGPSPLSKLSITGSDTSSSPVKIGLSDTGTSGILLPTSVASRINAAIGARGDNAIACSVASTGPDVVFTMGGTAFSVPASVYVYKQPNTAACQSQFLAGAENTGTVIFGATFLQCFYGIFDKNSKRVGFAQLVPGAGVTAGKVQGGALGSGSLSSVLISSVVSLFLTLLIS